MERSMQTQSRGLPSLPHRRGTRDNLKRAKQECYKVRPNELKGPESNKGTWTPTILQNDSDGDVKIVSLISRCLVFNLAYKYLIIRSIKSIL